MYIQSDDSAKFSHLYTHIVTKCVYTCIRTALKCANYFHPHVGFRRFLGFMGSHIFWLHSGEQRESLFVSLPARLSAQGALDIWDGKLKVALMKKAACVLEAAFPATRGGWRDDEKCQLSRSLVMIFWRFKRSLSSSPQMQNLSRSWSLRSRQQRVLLSATFIYTIRPLALFSTPRRACCQAQSNYFIRFFF